MARMSIDDKVCRDPRITVLAAALGWSRRETVGCLILDVWPICYDQECHLISERIIDAAAGREGFAQLMIDCELATRDRSGKVRVSGAKERIEYLNHKRRAGREGGIKSATSRLKYPKQTSSTGGSTTQAVGNPSVPDPVSVLVPVPAHKEGVAVAPLALVPNPSEPKPAQPPKLRPAANPDHQAAIDGFHVRYKAKYGTKPTWDGKAIGTLSNLLKKHTLATLLERMDFMFAGRAKWPPGPYSMDVFVANIDRFVEERGSVNTNTPLRKVEEL